MSLSKENPSKQSLSPLLLLAEDSGRKQSGATLNVAKCLSIQNKYSSPGSLGRVVSGGLVTGVDGGALPEG